MPVSMSVFSAFMIGILGSVHCLGMCGGIASALGSASNKRPAMLLLFQFFYSVGRICSYGIIGLLAGLVGFSLMHLLGKTGVYWLRTIAGLFLIAMGLYVSGWWMGLTFLERLGAKLWRFILKFAKGFIPAKNVLQAFMIGMFWGWLPCGLVYSTLIWCSSQGDYKTSALLMMSFGLGTLPSMLLVGTAAQSFRHYFQHRMTRRLIGIIIIIFGLWSLYLVNFMHHMPMPIIKNS